MDDIVIYNHMHLHPNFNYKKNAQYIIMRGVKIHFDTKKNLFKDYINSEYSFDNIYNRVLFYNNYLS